MNQFDAYVGQPFEILCEACYAAGKTIRITVLNGKPSVITRDLNVNRLNVIVTDNIVVAIGDFG